jgi:hypothetical protein
MRLPGGADAAPSASLSRRASDGIAPSLQDSREAARIAFRGRIIHLDAHFGAPCLRIEIRIDKRDHAFKFATRNRRSSKDGFLSQADIGQIALINFGMKPKPREITHFKEGFASLDVLAFESLFRQDRSADRRQQIDRKHILGLFGQTRHLLRAKSILHKTLRRAPGHTEASPPRIAF